MDGLDLKIFQDELVENPALFPIYDLSGALQKTFCNIGARMVAQYLGVSEFDDESLTADLMYAKIKKNDSGMWASSTGANAQAYAYKGGLAVAVMPSARMREEHGHICTVTQDTLVGSGSLGHMVPWVCNIGKGDPTKELTKNKSGGLSKPNWICKSSQAFPVAFGEAEYFIYKKKNG